MQTAPPRQLFYVTIALTLAVTAIADSVTPWASPVHPYRVRVQLDRPVSGPARLELEPQAVIDAVADVAVDQLDQESFAFEKAALVDPETGRVVGRFQLVPTGPPLEIDGSFAGLRAGQSPWSGFDPARMRFETVELAGETTDALMVSHDTLVNGQLTQPVGLQPGSRYLLEYWITMDPDDYVPGVVITDPRLSLFADQPHSYFNKMPAFGQWARQRVIVRPSSDESQLTITHAFTGRGGVANLNLRPVAWQFVLEPDRPVQALDLYVMARAGHRLTVPTEALIAESPSKPRVAVTLGEAQSQPLNPDGVLVSAEGVQA